MNFTDKGEEYDFSLGYPRRRLPQEHLNYPQAFPQQPYVIHTYQPTYIEPVMPYYNTTYRGAYVDDYEESGEVTTKPRLSKEQVAILESEFRRNPKPNSSHKRELAMQTGQEMPRICVSSAIPSFCVV